MDLKMPAGAEWWWTQPLSSLSLQPIVSVREQVSVYMYVCMCVCCERV